MKQYPVESYHIYPVKSLAGIEIKNPEITKSGLFHDRQFMLVDGEGNFISQRTHPSLCLLKTRIIEDQLEIYDGDESTTVDKISMTLTREGTKLKKVRVWDDKLDAYQVDQKINDWFSYKLSSQVQLVGLGTKSHRMKLVEKYQTKVPLSFADGYPILIIGTASLEELNRRLDIPIKMNRFRGNIIVKTNIPHIEDTWNTIQIGECVLKLVKPCPRCSVINIEQENGYSDKIISKTLSSYRKFDNQLFFGMNTICSKEGSPKNSNLLVLN